MSRRSFAGYFYQEKLRSGVYGDLYRASTAGGQEACLLEIDADLAGMPGFAEALTAQGNELTRIEHDHVVGTHSVGRAPDGHLVVITSAVPGQVSVEALLRNVAPKPLPHNIAAGISKQFIAGLAAVHGAGLVHGAVHPRSVFIDADGTVRIGDLAAGRALAAAIAKETTSPLRDSLAGYLAPEVLRGRLASKASDVFAAASVVYVMLAGTLPPGTLDISPGFERMIQRALDASLARRYVDAEEFLENLVEAMEDDLWPQAPPAEIAVYIADALAVLSRLDSSASEVVLSQATEDLLKSLKSVAPISPARPPESEPASLPPVSQSALPMSKSTVPMSKSDRLVDSVLAELEPPTRVDPEPAGEAQGRDPISELIALSDSVPASPGVRVLKPPAKQEPRPSGPPASVSQHGPSADPARVEEAALAAIASLGLGTVPPAEPAPDPESEKAALLAIAALDSDMAEPGRAGSGPGQAPRASSQNVQRPVSQEAPRAPSQEALRAPSQETPRVPSQPEARATSTPREEAAAEPRPVRRAVPAQSFEEFDPGLDVSLKKSSVLGRLFWFLVATGGIAALVWVVYTQSGLRKKQAEESEAQRANNEAVLAAFRASQPKSGQVTIDSEPDKAAVWMLLGRTPIDTNPMSAAMLHELRLEFEGYVPQDVRVSGQNWTGSGEAMKASVQVTMTPGSPDKPLPAYPPEPAAAERQGLREGQGAIHIQSQPPGAQVWLLVGFTPGVEVTGYAETDYEFKVLKDGYLPGYVTIKASDWKTEASGPQVSRSVKLQKPARGGSR